MTHQTMILILCILVFAPMAVAQQQTSDGGHVIFGTTRSYTHGQTDFLVYKLNAAGQKQWRKNFGGEDYESPWSMVQSTDGGYTVTGHGNSYGNGSRDFLVYKLNAAGQKQWRKVLGGDDHDWCSCVGLTGDGGYILAGTTYSYIHEPGGYGAMGVSYPDMLVYKINGTGAKQWRKNFGGTEVDYGKYIEQTGDGGYILAGYGKSYTHGASDILVYKLDGAGSKQWRKNYGGIYEDHCHWIRQTTDGGYILAGTSNTYTNGGDDFLVYRLDASGNKLWRKNFGGLGLDQGHCIQQTTDGGYIIAGHGGSYSNGAYDLLVYKLNAAGQKQWRKNYGGGATEYGHSIWQTVDGGYLLFGDTETYTNGSTDLICYKLNAAGQKQWRKNYGGPQSDYLFAR